MLPSASQRFQTPLRARPHSPHRGPAQPSLVHLLPLAALKEQGHTGNCLGGLWTAGLLKQLKQPSAQLQRICRICMAAGSQ